MEDSLVQPGDPLIIVEMESGEMITPPKEFVTVDPSKVKGAVLSFGRLGTKAGVAKTWILQSGKSLLNERRSLRLCLLRLHAEQEVLNSILKQLKARRILHEQNSQFSYDPTTVTEDLNDYFNTATRLIDVTNGVGFLSQRSFPPLMRLRKLRPSLIA
jgi:hypothetical protein